MSEPSDEDVWIIQSALYVARNARDDLVARQAEDALIALDRLVRSRRNAIATAHRLRRVKDAAQQANRTENWGRY